MTKSLATTADQRPIGQEVHFAPGEIVFSEGDRGAEMFILQSGRVEILKMIGGHQRRLAVLENGDFFGEMALLEELPRNATVRALERVDAVAISPGTFDRMLRENPEIVVRMMRRLSARLRRVEGDLDHALRPARAVAAAGGTQGRRAIPNRAGSTNRLTTKSGDVVFYLSVGDETTIGRRDSVTGIDPDIDLSEVDASGSTSRAHAKIYHRGRKFFLREEIGTANGTYLNHSRLETGVPVELVDGDQVRFGAVELWFRVGQGGG